MRSKCSLAFLALGLISTVTLSACSSGSGGNNGGGGNNVITVAIQASGSTNIFVNQNLQFTVTVTGTTNVGVTWRVNGTAGGDINTIGSINTSGLYNAPGTPPTGNGTVTVTAVSDADNKTTSNAVTVSVANSSALSVSPAAPQILAGNMQTFAAMQNGAAVTATWGVSSSLGGDIGSIDPNTGIYTAPLNIPPGQSVTITATTANGSASTNAVIIFSAASFHGQYAMAFNGRDSNGIPLDVAGSFASTGAASGTTGTIAGVMDINRAGAIATACPMTGNFSIGPDGRSSGTITCAPSEGGKVTFSIDFTLISNRHALLADFDESDTGTGTIDMQDTSAPFSANEISGIYVFTVAGVGTSGGSVLPASAGGSFTAVPTGDGVTGTISVGSGVEDVVFPVATPALTKGDQTLGGSYELDTNNLSLGRGTLILTTSSTNPLETATFAFYIIDRGHMKLVEIDSVDDFALGGEMYSGPAGPFNVGAIAGNYALGVKGWSPSGRYGLAGAWTYNGGPQGQITAGEEDFNNGGAEATSSGQILLTSTYIVSPGVSTSGKFDRFLVNIKDVKGRQYEYAIYLAAPAAGQTYGLGLMQEIDYDPPTPGGTGFGTGIVATGMTFPQASSSSIPTGGGFALSLGGTAMDQTVSSDQTVLGAVDLSSIGLGISGNLDVDKPLGATGTATAISLSNGSQFQLPDAFGRGAAKLDTTTLGVTTFGLVYYLIDDDTAILLDTDGSRSATGSIARQF